MNQKLLKTVSELSVSSMYRMQLTVALAAYADMNEGGVEHLNFLLKTFSQKEEKDDRKNIIKWIINHTNLSYSTKKKRLNRTHEPIEWSIFKGLHEDLFISASAAKKCSEKFNCLSIDDFPRVIRDVDAKIEQLERTVESLGRDDPFYNKIQNTAHAHLVTDRFKWPSTIAYMSNGNIPEVDWPQVGMLQGVGYAVGAKGLPKAKRHELLSNIMSQQLPFVTSYAYRQEWEEPNTTARLKKLANTIASLSKNAKRRSNNNSIAISAWEEDLKWLKEKYYKNGKYSWQWPN